MYECDWLGRKPCVLAREHGAVCVTNRVFARKVYSTRHARKHAPKE